jgi:hypothetical protein
MPHRRHLSVLLFALLVPSAAAVKLELPTFLKTAASFSGKAMPSGPVTDLWWNPLILLSGTRQPTVQDNANAYARWGDRRDSFVEVAIWRTTNGKAIVGVNAVKPPVDTCGDYPCGPAAAFLGYDGQRYVQPGEDTVDIEIGCTGILRVPDETDAPELSRVLRAAQGRVKSYAKFLRGGGPVGTMCIFPQHGTTITVAVRNSNIAFASKGRVLPLYYFKFDKVKGTFTPSVQP